MPARAALALAVLLLFAGCLSAPTESPGSGGTGTVQYSVSNDASDSVQVVLSVVPPAVDTYRIEYANGSNRTIEDVPNVSALAATVPDDAVAVVPVGEDAVVRRYTLESGSGVGGTFEAVPDDAVVLQSVGHPDGSGFRGVSAASCADASLTRIELDVNDAGEALTVTCAETTTATAATAG